MQVRGRVLDASEREGLDGAVHRGHAAVDHLGREEALGLEIVHQVVGVVGGLVAVVTVSLAEEELLASHLALGSFFRVQFAENVQFGGRGEVQNFLKFRHGVHLVASA